MIIEKQGILWYTVKESQRLQQEGQIQKQKRLLRRRHRNSGNIRSFSMGHVFPCLLRIRKGWDG